jgi:hypothetical protein
MQLSQSKRVEMRWWPCIVYIGNRYKIGHYKGEVLIALISVLNVMPLAIIYIVIYIYIANNLKLGVLLAGLG